VGVPPVSRKPTASDEEAARMLRWQHNQAAADRQRTKDEKVLRRVADGWSPESASDGIAEGFEEDTIRTDQIVVQSPITPVEERLATAMFRKRGEADDLYREQKGRCAYCGAELHGKFHLDHKIPISRRGLTRRDNLCCVCSACNLSKSTMTAKEFLGGDR